MLEDCILTEAAVTIQIRLSSAGVQKGPFIIVFFQSQNG